MTDAILELQSRAEQDYVNAKARKRRNYRLARNLGFTWGEAKLLSGRSDVYIAQLAKQRMENPDGMDRIPSEPQRAPKNSTPG